MHRCLGTFLVTALFIAAPLVRPAAAQTAATVPAAEPNAPAVKVDLSLALALPDAPGYFQRHGAVTAGDLKFRMTYGLFLPPEYFQSKDPYPLFIHLHNAGAKGLGGARLTSEGLSSYWSGDAGRGDVENDTRMNVRRSAKYIGLAPQLPTNYEWKTPPVPDALWELVCQLSHTYRIDFQRIYLTGYSYGGTNTWEVSLALPHRFAAIVPISGRASSPNPDQDVRQLLDTGIYLACGTADKTFLPFSEQMRDALKNARHPNFIYRTVLNGGHGCYPEIFVDRKFWEWLYAQRRSSGPASVSGTGQ